MSVEGVEAPEVDSMSAGSEKALEVESLRRSRPVKRVRGLRLALPILFGLTAGSFFPEFLDAQVRSGSGERHDSRERPVVLENGEAKAVTSRTLTLEDALELAGRHNPGYRQALNERELSAPGRRAALGEFLPSLNLSAGTSQSFSRITRAEDPLGNPIENPEAQTRVSSGSSQGIQASITLFEGGARFHRLGENRAQDDARRASAELEWITLRAGVERAFFEAQQQGELLDLEEGMLEGRRRDLDATERLFSLAARGRTDILGAELEIRQQERAIEDRRSEHRKAVLALRTLLGDPELPDLELVSAAVEIFDPAELDAEGLARIARENNPRIRAQEANVGVSRASRAVTGANRWPTVTLNGGFNRNVFGVDQEALFRPFPQDQGGSLSLNVSLPVFQRFAPSNQRAQADVALRNANEGLREIELEVEEGVRARIIDLENAYRSLQIEESSRELADERLRLTQEEYRLAGKTFEELQTAVRAAADARRQALTARYAFVLARIALEETVGGVVEIPAGATPAPGDR